MKITKLKKMTKGKYKLFLDNNDSLMLYEDVIVNNALLPNKTIDSKLMSDLNKENYYATAYNQSLNYISIKLRSREELNQYLIKKGYDTNVIDDTIKHLTNEGYLDDYSFAIAFVNDKLNLSNFGPYRIERELNNCGVSQKIIDEVISNIANDIVKEKLMKIIDKQIKINKKYTGNILKKRILNYLINLGYSYDMALPYLNDINSNNDNLSKEYQKLYKKYSSKYKDYELKMIIKQKLYQKGYENIDLDNLN